jgi:predicted Zn finger-like uncharacterized protein
MYTCCPHCKTCFRITKAQLDVAQGKVRCGRCKEIYNAKLHLHDEPPGSQASSDTQPATKPSGLAGPDLDLFAAHADTSTQIQNTTPEDDLIEETIIFADTGEFDIPAEETPESTAEIDTADLDETFTIGAEDSLDDLFLDDELDDVLDDELDDDLDEDLDLDDVLDDELDDDLDEDLDLDDVLDDELDDDLDEDLDLDDELLDGEPEPTAIIETGNVAAEFLSQFGKAQPDTRSDDSSTQQGEDPAKVVDNPEPPSRYQYVDPEDLIKEEKDIAELLEEMNAQLTQDNDEQVKRNPLMAGLDVDANPDSLVESGKPQTDIPAPQPAPPPQPPAKTDEDDFEQSFLASLDATMSRTAATPTKPAPMRPDAPPSAPDTAPLFSTPAHPRPAGSYEAEMPLRLRESLVVEKPPFSPIRFIFSLLAIVILLGTLLVQLAMFRGSELIEKLPALQPVVDRICSGLPCRYSGPRDVSQIKLINRDVRLHPSANNALRINATFVNRAPFKQPYPVMTITLSDLSGAVIAQRSFTPAEYLGGMNQPNLLMPSGQPVRVKLEVVDPGKDAVNFEFTFSDSIKQN